jgi:aminobenzoyl-glutamate utilization protein B
MACAASEEFVLRTIESRRAVDRSVALDLWNWAEVGYQEQQSTARLQEQLKTAGFDVKADVAGIPTAFVASYGSGKPIIAILAEMDALPGVPQAAMPERSPLPGRVAGHACGHHLFGAGSTSAAIAVKEWLVRTKTRGTIRLYGTPAEEGGAGKVYMVRAGLFDDVDVALHWHPSDRNTLLNVPTLANKSAKFRFRGFASHAAGAPERGRSALDGVEAMDTMVNLMREHVPSDTRIHYVITRGGEAPNVVPAFAEVYYYVRHPDPRVMQEIFDRIVRASEGAALGTGTTVEHEIIHGTYSLLPNDALAAIAQKSLQKVGGVQYDEQERAFAEKILPTLDEPDIELGSERTVIEPETKAVMGSTDVGDVSWTVPTIGLRIATWVPGTPSHSWQAVAAGGMTIGLKGMENAAKALALTATKIYTDPQVLRAAQAEFQKRRGADFKYVPLIGERAPPLEYRR